MKLISSILKTEVIDKLNNTLVAVEFGAFDPEEQTQDVTFCDLKWLKLYLDRLQINNVAHLVTAINHKTVTIKLDAELIGDEVFALPIPLFFNGTLSNTKWEWNKYVNPQTNINSERDKLPFIWLISPTDERIDSYNDGGGRNVDAKIWFVHWSDWTKLNADRQDEAVQPLYALVDEFVNTMLRQSATFDGNTLGHLRRDFPKFGTENENGIDKAIFDSSLSAVELDANFKIISTYCENC